MSSEKQFVRLKRATRYEVVGRHFNNDGEPIVVLRPESGNSSFDVAWDDFKSGYEPIDDDPYEPIGIRAGRCYTAAARTYQEKTPWEDLSTRERGFISQIARFVANGVPPT